MDRHSLMMATQEGSLSLTGNKREKCGICCTPFLSRGVLDCCSHIFCYSCIDTWSAFTSLCPLCKRQFKSITLVSELENEDSSEVDTEGAFSDFLGDERDVCWNDVNEEDGLLSFPSYFIDEDAVVCLDGDGCRARAAHRKEDEESGLWDTSVACDSCDCWYHAICVGFKPEYQNQGSWICPRCAGNAGLDLSGSNLVKNSASIQGSNESVILDGKVAVTIVDPGETAVVVSMHSTGLQSESTSNSSVDPNSSTTHEHIRAPNENMSLIENGVATAASAEGRAIKAMESKANAVLVASAEDTGIGVMESAGGSSAMAVSFFSAHDTTEAKHDGCEGCKEKLVTEGESSASLNCTVQLPLDSGLKELCSIDQTESMECLEDDSLKCMGKNNENEELLQCSVTDISYMAKDDRVLLSEVTDVPTENPESTLTNKQDTSSDKSSSDPIDVESKIITNVKFHNVTLQEHKADRGSDKQIVNKCMSHGKDIAKDNRFLTSDVEGVHTADPEATMAKEEDAASDDSLSDAIDAKSKFTMNVELNSVILQDHKADMGSDKKIVNKRMSPGSVYIKSSKKIKLEDRDIPLAKSIESSAKHEGRNATRANQNKDVQAPVKVEEPSEVLSMLSIANENLSNAPLELHTGTRKRKSSNMTVDVLNELKEMVQGPNPKTQKKTTSQSAIKNEKECKGSHSGVRTRKIVHGEGGLVENTLVIAEKLLQHLKAAADPGAVPSSGGKMPVTDENFFAAFRAAMISSQASLKQQAHVVQSKMSPQKGHLRKDGARQSLIKKLYGGTGKRRQAWDRDWDVTFWKSRAMSEKKERDQANKDLLMHLAKIEKTSNVKEARKAEVDSLRNRVYLADTSLLPRQTDIQPLSVQLGGHKESLKSVQKTETVSITKTAKGVLGHASVGKKQGLERKEKLPISCNNKTQDSERSSSSDTAFGNRDGMSDKQRWALEVLARKTEQTKKETVIRGNDAAQEGLPLLMELPAHLRPILEYDRRSKVPTATRQVHLDRLVECYLQKSNTRAMGDNAECRAAIAQALQKEKEIYTRANTKGVYMNLCVQALSSILSQQNEAKGKIEVILPQAAEMLPLEAVDYEDEAVVRALKETGLLSDSPPESPSKQEIEDSTSLLCSERNISYPDNDAVLTHDCKEARENDTHIQETQQPVIDLHTVAVSEVLPSVTADANSCEFSSSDILLSHEQTGQKASLLETPSAERHSFVEVGNVPANGEILAGAKDFKEGGREIVDRQESEGPKTSNDESLAGVKDLKEQEGREIVDRQEMKHQTLALEREAVGQEEDHCLSVEPETGKRGSISKMMAGEATCEEMSQVNVITEAISKQVQNYVKEHIRPLHRSHVITTDQYRWAVLKTTKKVMQHHSKARSADFLIPEGEKVKRLAEQYLDLFKQQKPHVKN